MTKWKNFAEWLFLGLITYLAYDFSTSVVKLKADVSEMRQDVAINKLKIESTDKTSDDHESRIRDLENKRRK